MLITQSGQQYNVEVFIPVLWTLYK